MKTMIIAVLSMLVVSVFIINVCDTPVILQTNEGQVCGCIHENDVPTLDECDVLTDEQKEEAEIIIVSKC